MITDKNRAIIAETMEYNHNEKCFYRLFDDYSAAHSFAALVGGYMGYSHYGNDDKLYFPVLVEV